MPRAGLTRDAVTSAARRLLENPDEPLTLAALSADLGVRTPSLYKHVGGLEDLRIAVSVVIKRELLGGLTDTVTGRSGDDAVHRLSVAYREWALRNPGAYPYTLTAANPSSEADVEVSDQLVRVIAATLRGYALDADAEVHVIRRLRAILHGFVALELGGGFALPQDVDESFSRAVESFLTSLAT